MRGYEVAIRTLQEEVEFLVEENTRFFVEKIGELERSIEDSIEVTQLNYILILENGQPTNFKLILSKTKIPHTYHLRIISQDPSHDLEIYGGTLVK